MLPMLTTEYHPIPLPDYSDLLLEEMRQRATSFYELIRKRHTVRDFSPRPVPRGIIEDCLLAAGTAPDGANHQPWHFAVIGNQEIKKQICAAAEKQAAFYSGCAGEEWSAALRPLGTDASKPLLGTALRLICIFGERKSRSADGKLRKNNRTIMFLSRSRLRRDS